MKVRIARAAWQSFVLRRGRAMAVIELGLAASLALLPPLSRALIDAVGWREAYVALGAMVWALVIPASALLARDTPEKMGLHPDGLPHRPLREAATPPGAVGEYRVVFSLTFWLLALPLATVPFVLTALAFHQAGIFAERGLCHRGQRPAGYTIGEPSAVVIGEER